jgi:hypothetical protein
MPTGVNQIHKIVYQNDSNNPYVNSKLRYEALASSGVPVTPKYLSANDAEYQFLYPSGATNLYLPNGTGLYMGKKFTIVNINSSYYNISIYKSSDLISAFHTLPSNYNITIVHGGDNNWFKLSDSISNL